MIDLHYYFLVTSLLTHLSYYSHLLNYQYILLSLKTVWGTHMNNTNWILMFLGVTNLEVEIHSVPILTHNIKGQKYVHREKWMSYSCSTKYMIWVKHHYHQYIHSKHALSVWSWIHIFLEVTTPFFCQKTSHFLYIFLHMMSLVWIWLFEYISARISMQYTSQFYLKPCPFDTWM